MPNTAIIFAKELTSWDHFPGDVPPESKSSWNALSHATQEELKADLCGTGNRGCNSVCDISVYIEGDHPGALHAWHRRGGSGCTDGSKRIYDFPENYLPTYQMGIALRNRALYGKSDGRVWCGICFVRSPSGKNKYDAALH